MLWKSQESERGREREREREMAKEALVVCSDKSLNAGITIWDMDTGDQLLHIPTCASPPHGLLCLKNQFLVASQVQKHGSCGGGAIFFWPFNKPQAPFRNYPIEAIAPLACTKDGSYLAGGAPSGNAYVWQLSSGRMLKNWHAHQRSLNCLTFSSDDSLLISGSDDGEIRVWTMISLLDMGDHGSAPPFFHSLLEHQSSVTGLLCAYTSSSSTMVSSSLDGTCKVWDLITGTVIRTQAFPESITAITLDPGEQLLFSGTADGSIFVNALDAGLIENSDVFSEDYLMVLKEHMGPVTALSFSPSGLFLISAAEDCTVCLWEVNNWVIARSFNHKKGRITNMVAIPWPLLLPAVNNNQKVSHQARVSLLDKYPPPASSSRGTTTFLPTYCSLEDGHMNTAFQSTNTMNQQILDLEQGRTPAAIQMKVETSVENRLWASSMARHVTDMNKHLQSRLLDLMQRRLSRKSERSTNESRKKLKVGNATTSGKDRLKLLTGK